jgi:hypothetical protein
MTVEARATAAFIRRELPELEKLAAAFLADARRARDMAVRIPGRRPKPMAPVYRRWKKHCRIFEHEKE